MDFVLLDAYLESNATNIQSIPELHTCIQAYFNDINTKTIPALKMRRKYWSHIKHSVPEGTDKWRQADAQNRKIKQNIRQLESQEHAYYANNMSILFTYFENRKPVASASALNNQMRLFFTKRPATTTETSSTYDKSVPSGAIIQDMYMQNIFNDIPDMRPYIIPYNKCVCGNGELVPCEEDGVMICNFPNCGNMVDYVTSASFADGKEHPNEISYSAYTRLVHFKEILAQTQGRSTNHISTEVVEKIRERIKRERITDLSKLTIVKMREILRNLRLTDNYFDHVQYLRKLMGVYIPSIPENLQNIYCNMFLEVQRPWNDHKPEERHNFSNCGYLLYQFCILTNQTQYLSHIHLLQRDKLEEHDKIFELVCKDLGWKFTPIPK